jgi:predicted metal-binding membrane protein
MHRAQSVILLSLLAVIASAWAYLIYLYWQMNSLPMSEIWMAPSDQSAWKIGDFGLVYLMWAAMMAGMMLPSAIPMILAFSQACKNRYSTPLKFSFLFISSYILVWLLFSVAMSLLQWQLHGLHVLSPMMDTESEYLASMIFLGTGVYQLTPLKNSFLRYCRSPAGFLLNEWQDGAKGAFNMGLRHGSTCVGCCWAQMLIMFAVGVMNLFGMALITLVILVEKVAPLKSDLISRSVGILFVGWGLWLLQMQ